MPGTAGSPGTPDPDAMESQRRCSTSSDTSSNGQNESAGKVDPNMEYIPTRMTKVSTPKPAANPLQFVKVGPCDLFKSAQETLKKVEEVKKMKKEVREEAEEWQSNLDNWKCSRRKRVEHIIDRVVEVKKLELEEHERNRRKGKTFSEMMEERTSRGRKMSLLVHKDDDSNDLSDLGIGTSSDKSSVSEDYGNDDNHSVGDGEDSVKSHYIDQNLDNKSSRKGSNGINHSHDDDTSTSTTISSPEPEEYTYDRAIQGYVNFTETRVKSRSVCQSSRTETERSEESQNGSICKSQNDYMPQGSSAATTRRESVKVEEEISDLEKMQSRKFSDSLSDLQNADKKLIVPKVDVSKRKELFEKPSEMNDQNDQSKVAPRAAGDFANTQSIRDRVSNLKRQQSEEGSEKSKQLKRLSSEISVKDRLSILEKQKSSDNLSKMSNVSKLNSRASTGELNVSPRTIKDRLSSLEQTTHESKERTTKVSLDVSSTSIKSRVCELESPKESPKKLTPDRDPAFHDKLANFQNTEVDTISLEISKSDSCNVVESSPSPDTEMYQKRVFHRSLDSLDVDSSALISNEPFERVQSLEDLDSCSPNRNYPASASSNENLLFSSQSGDTDREDSGIHTADVSCSVSQADEPADVGDVLPVNSANVENNSSYLIESENVEDAPPTIVSQLAKLNLSQMPYQPAERFSPEDLILPSEATGHNSISSSVVVSPESTSPSEVLVDSPVHLAVSVKPFLPTIPESYHDCPPAVVVSDSELVTPNTGALAFSPSSTSLPLETCTILEGSTEIETGCCGSQSKVMGQEDNGETPSLCVHVACLHGPNAKGACLDPEGASSHCSKASNSAAQQEETIALISECTIPGNLYGDQDVPGVLVDSNSRPEVDKGPKPYNPKSKEESSYFDRDMSSVTSAETDTDVSSFLEQAFLEEDLKMEPPTPVTVFSDVSGKQYHEHFKHEVMYPIGNNEASPVNVPGDVSILPLSFPLDVSSLAEPPKEKPPPPPMELSDDEEKIQHISNSEVGGTTHLHRFDSTKRLKKEIRRKRSDFLGIEGANDDSYFEPELNVAPPPDMTTFLQEERRLEQELYRQSQPAHYSESDQSSNQSEQLYRDVQQNYSESDQGSNQGESRDSGVELDSHLHPLNMHTDDSGNQSCETHSRQNSEPFGNASSASEEDEIVKKEREIIEILEKEEQWRYGTNTILSPTDHHQVGEKLAAKLRELEQEKMRLEWERAEESRRLAAEQVARQEEQRRLQLKEQQLLQQESIVGRVPAEVPRDCNSSNLTPEAIREERERLKREHAELERQREMLAASQMENWSSSSTSSAHRSLQDVSASSLAGSHSPLAIPPSNTPLNYRLSLPDLQQSDSPAHSVAPRAAPHHRRPPPPIPPAKPLIAVSQERRGLNGSARHLPSSADSLPLALDPQHHRHNAVGLPAVPSAASPTSSTGSQQMTRQTLHALSAVPRSKIIATDTWVQAKRKPENQRNTNRDHYQHWLIQEAEHRRITEQQQRNAASRKSLPTPQPHPKLPIQPVQPQVQQQWQFQHNNHHPLLPHQAQHHQHAHLVHHPHKLNTQAPVQAGVPPVPPPPRQEKPLPDAIIQTLTQRVQNRVSLNENTRRLEKSPVRDSRQMSQLNVNNINNNNNTNVNHTHSNGSYAANSQEKMLSVSGKKKCSHCNEELGRGAAMIIESLRLFYHMDCFKCCVCHVQLGDGLMGTDVRVRNQKLHCHNCYSSDDGVKFSCV